MKQIQPGILILIMSAFLCLQPMDSAAQEKDASSSWISFDKMVEMNGNQPKKIMLFMEADWCSICKSMKREVFPDPAVQNLLNDYFYPVRMDIESKESIWFRDERMTKMELSKQFEIRGTPTILFLDPDYSVIGSNVGYSDINEFKHLLTYIYTEEYQHSSFEDYMDDI